VIDLEVKKHSWVPGAKYDILSDWSKPEKFATSQGRVRGKFLKNKKMTMTEEVLTVQKKKNVPAPNAYKT
jgi:hypothetical protein